MSDPQMSRRINKRKSDRKSCTVESKRKLQDTEDDSEGEPTQNNKNIPIDPNFERKRKISNKSKTSTSKSPNGNESTDPEEVNIQNNQVQSTDNNTNAASIRSSRKSKDRERKNKIVSLNCFLSIKIYKTLIVQYKGIKSR